MATKKGVNTMSDIITLMDYKKELQEIIGQVKSVKNRLAEMVEAMDSDGREVDSLDEALAHIRKYSSGHSEAIITENKETAMRFQKEVDAACVYWNAPTSFTDGAQFGLGAEIGISTQKLGPRGPMALEEMTTYKWIIEGDGQIRS